MEEQQAQIERLLKGIRELESKVQYLDIKLWIAWVVCIVLVTLIAMGRIEIDHNCLNN